MEKIQSEYPKGLWEKYADIRSCSVSELGGYTSTGYVIIERVEEDVLEEKNECVGVMEAVSQHGCIAIYGGPQYGNRSHVLRKAFFLIGRPKNDVVVDLHDQMKKRDEVFQRVKNERDVLLSVKSDLEKEIETIKSCLDLSRGRAETLREEVKRGQERIELMACDLSRLREALGTKQFDEIIKPVK